MNSAQQIYWNELQQLRTSLAYLRPYLQLLESWDMRIEIALAIIGTGSLGVLAIDKDFPQLWLCIIVGSQVITTIKPILLYNKRRKAVHGLMRALENVVVDVDNTWFQIARGELTARQIHESIVDIRRKKMSADKDHFVDLTLPRKLKLMKAAEEDASEYLKRHY